MIVLWQILSNLVKIELHYSVMCYISLSLSVLFLSVSLPDEPVVEMEDIMTTVDSITITWTTSPTVTGAVVSWEVSTEARKGHPLQFTIAIISILGA